VETVENLPIVSILVENGLWINTKACGKDVCRSGKPIFWFIFPHVSTVAVENSLWIPVESFASI